MTRLQHKKGRSQSEMKRNEEPQRKNVESMSGGAGPITFTENSTLPYGVTLFGGGAQGSEHRFETMQECEAFVRRNTPSPSGRSTLYDRPAGESLIAHHANVDALAEEPQER